MLCANCLLIRIFEKFSLRDKFITKRHQTPADLMLSGRGGCELCVFIHEVLTKAFTQWQLLVSIRRFLRLAEGLEIQVATRHGECVTSLVLYKEQS